METDNLITYHAWGSQVVSYIKKVKINLRPELSFK